MFKFYIIRFKRFESMSLWQKLYLTNKYYFASCEVPKVSWSNVLAVQPFLAVI